MIAVHTQREEQFSDRLRANANCKGCTALHYAALVDDVKTIRALLNAGKYYRLPPHLSCEVRNFGL